MTAHRTIFTVGILVIVVTCAGCSAVLPGTSDPGTPTAEQTPKPTSAPSPAITATPTPTPTHAPAETSSPTPTPRGSKDHRLFAEQYASELRKFGPNHGSWIRHHAAYENGTVSITVHQPDEWTVKRTEMEAVREAVRGITIVTTSNESKADLTDLLYRPNKIRIRVTCLEGQPITTVYFDTELAIKYANKEITLRSFATHLKETRHVHVNSKLGENSTAYYLKIAEWRHLRDEHLALLRQADRRGETVGEIRMAKIRPKKSEIYYEYSPPGIDNATVREATFMRTYWEAIQNVSERRLMHRYPERMRVYAEVPGDTDLESSVRTEFAFDFLAITGGNISDDNLLENGAYPAYYNKVNRTYYEDS